MAGQEAGGELPASGGGSPASVADGGKIAGDGEEFGGGGDDPRSMWLDLHRSPVVERLRRRPLREKKRRLHWQQLLAAEGIATRDGGSQSLI
ncbi:hypothetical protein TIFTF001_011618 [Ficus carica]|uniref:Uncharacterized protein n=1 Tax=Ficus carica TaxID=3494 RepID=A0AA87ZS21_FICCA|nr:hypothetical protein TIFTF001_011618 [Ficus carica]